MASRNRIGEVGFGARAVWPDIDESVHWAGPLSWLTGNKARAVHSTKWTLANSDSRALLLRLPGQRHDLGLDEAFHEVRRRSSKHADAAGVGQQQQSCSVRENIRHQR